MRRIFERRFRKKTEYRQRTVKAHTGSIYSKLGVKTRAQCVKLVY